MAVCLRTEQGLTNGLSTKNEYLLKTLLYGTAVFNAADFFMTNLILNMGYSELNPLMDMIVHTTYFALLKLLIIPISLYYIWRKRYIIGRRILYYAWIVFVPYLLLMVYFKFIFWTWVI